MSDAIETTVDTTEALTPGQMLLEARNYYGRSQAQIAEMTHLSLQVIKDLEADDYRHISAQIYVRGYLRAFARAVRLDESLVLRAFDTLNAMGKATVGKEEKLTSPMSPPITSMPTSRRTRSAILWAGLIAIILILFFGMIWVRDAHKSAAPGAAVAPKKSHATSASNAKNAQQPKTLRATLADTPNPKVQTQQLSKQQIQAKLKDVEQQRQTQELNKIQAAKSKAAAIQAAKTQPLKPNYTVSAVPNT